MNSIELEEYLCNMSDDYCVNIDDMPQFQNDVEELLKRQKKEVIKEIQQDIKNLFIEKEDIFNLTIYSMIQKILIKKLDAKLSEVKN